MDKNAFNINKGLLKGSLILLICFGIFNFLNFMFHFSMARSLSLVDYGILATLYSILYALSIFTESIQLIITKYTAKENNKGKLKNIFLKTIKKSSVVSVLIFALYLAVALPLSSLLKIEYPLLALNGLAIFLFFLIPVSRGVMQGQKRFGSLGINMIIESSAKLAFSIFFVYLGWKVYGAVVGTLIASVLAFVLSLIAVKDILKINEENADTKGIYAYTGPAFILSLTVMLFYSIDIIIAKAFFSPATAGSYAVASILAKTIFWGTQPISKAMFPLSAQDSDAKNRNNVFSNSFAILLSLVIAALALFFVFPELIIRIFSGKEIFEASQILFYVGIAMALLSFANLIVLYDLSLGKIKPAPKKLYAGFFALFLASTIFGIVYVFYPYYLFFYLTALLVLLSAAILFYCLIKKYDLGFIFFLIIEAVLLYIFKNNLFVFSIAFVTSAAAFLWGAVMLMKNNK